SEIVMHTQHERGIALVLALFLMSAMSVLAASLMFLSQTETYASMNYRMMSQARYAGEAGVQKAANYLLTTYPVPQGAATMAKFNRLNSPVTCAANCPTINGPVVLSTVDAESNYPDAAVQAAFKAAAMGQLAAGNATLTYGGHATLLAMQQFDSYGGTSNVVQTWEITANGTLAGPRNATVQV